MKIDEKRWENLDKRYITLQNDIDLDNYLAPVNRAEELEKFRKKAENNEPCNPQFRYEALPEVHEKALIEFLGQLDPEQPVERIYYDAVRFRLGEITAARHHNGKTVTEISLLIYGRPDKHLLEAARYNLETIKVDQSAYLGKQGGKVYTAQELADLCTLAMKQYGFDWKVVVKPEMGAKMAVDNLIREFWIREDVKFHESLVKMTVVHEIGTHVLRSENGYAQPLTIFGRGLPAYQFTEEGLAEYAEEQCGALLPDTVFRISGRAIGADVALNGSFWDVYSAVRPYFDIDMAFDIAQRTKLGIADTSEPGSYTKDYTYLAGLHRIREFFRDITLESVDALFAGKVGLNHIKAVTALQKDGYLLKPKAYPEWFCRDRL